MAETAPWESAAPSDEAPPWAAQPAQEASGTVPVVSDAESAQAAMRQNFQQGNYLRSLGDMFYGMGATAVQSLIEGHARTSELMDKEAGGNLTDEERLELGLNFGMGLGGGGEVPRAVRGPIREFQDTVINPGLQKIAAEARPPANTPEGVMAQPEVRDAIANGPVNRDNHVPYEAGASKGADNTTNIDKSIPEIAKLPSGTSFDTATPLKIHEQVEKFVMDKLTAGGMSDEAAYRVGHWEYAERAEDAWYASQGIDPREAEAWWQERAGHIEHEPTNDTPPDLYAKPYPHDSVTLAHEDTVATQKPTPEEIAQAQQILGKSSEEMGGHLADFFKARELGVIGEAPQPNINRMPPKEAAAHAIPARRKADETISGEVEQPNAWRQRFEQTLDKMETPEDARALIRNALDRNNDFEDARQGYISAAQTEKLSDVTGLDPQHIDVGKTSAKIKTNEEMRNVVRAFRAINDKIAEAAQDLTAKGGHDDEAELEKYIKLGLQRDVLMNSSVETYVAFRAEFGRAGNILQEFMKIKRAAGDTVRIARDHTGRSTDDLRNEARMISATPVEDLPRTLEKLRRDPIGPVYWTWIQGLISGWLTHTKYFAANEFYADIERGIVTPIAATIGKAKQLTGIDTDRVLFGETAAGLWGQFASVPKAIYVTGKAVRAGVRVPLEDEIALYKSAIERGEKVPTPIQKVVEASQIPAQRGVTGEFVRKTTEPVITAALGVRAGEKVSGALGYGWSRFLGAPGDMASGIHTFYRVRGRQASMEALAYRKAIGEGLSPTSGEFWRRQQWHVANPTDEMRVKAVADSYDATFMGELSPEMKQLAGAVRKNKYLKWVFPFMHIPLKLLEAFQGYTPLAVLNPEMREALMGKAGGAEQDKALARLVVGTSIMGYVYHKFMMGRATGDFPQDPKERKLWQMQGKQANSILIGDHWVSFDRFGTVGDLARMGANLGHAAQLWQQDGKVGDGLDQQLEDFAGALALSAIRQVTDEVGFQSLQRAVEAWDNKEKWGEFIGMEASSFIPFSSAVSQTSSGGLPFTGTGGDPYMRKIHGMWDAIKYRLPGARETLPVKRDWMGRPVPNPQFGNILRQTVSNQNAVDLELMRIGVTPGPARNDVGGVKLSQEDYDRYVATAAPQIERMLTGLMQSPTYRNAPQAEQVKMAHGAIAAARAQARQAMQAHQHELIREGNQQREQAILGR